MNLTDIPHNMQNVHTAKRLPDCPIQIYNGNAIIDGLQLVRNIDDIQSKCMLKVVALQYDIKDIEGLYTVTDILRGNRRDVIVKGIDVDNEGTIEQKLLGVSINVYKIDRLKNPEYFL